MAIEKEAPGFYGKVPDVGDFVSRRLPQEFIQPWDYWLQGAISCSSEQLGSEWLEVYLTSPIWRFAISPGIVGPDAWRGVLMPSVDRVGRYFPFTIAHKISPEVSPIAIACSDQTWFESAEKLALSALNDDTPTIEQLDKLAFALGSSYEVEQSATRESQARGTGWWLASPIRTGYAEIIETYLPSLVGQLLGSFSLWWSAGSEYVDSGIAVCEGLPDVHGYAAMLAGNWEIFGWERLNNDISKMAVCE